MFRFCHETTVVCPCLSVCCLLILSSYGWAMHQMVRNASKESKRPKSTDDWEAALMVSGGANSAPQFPATAMHERFGRSKCRQFEVVAGTHSTITSTSPLSRPPSPASSAPPTPISALIFSLLQTTRLLFFVS